MKAKDLELGSIVWYKDLIVGVKGIALDTKYNECEVSKIVGNRYDYEITPNSTEMKEELEKALTEQEDE